MGGRLHNVSISNVVAVGAMTASSITGVPGYPVSAILLRNVRVTARGGAGPEVAAQKVPELPTCSGTCPRTASIADTYAA